ncbi:MAG: SAM-dependent methyltransferase [Pseudomonadota bacterium]
MEPIAYCSPLKDPMPGYQLKLERVQIPGVDDLQIRSLLDRQQYADPDGSALRQGVSSGTWPLFGLLWPSGHELACRMARHPLQAGQRILEMGCGLALASLVGHRRGADVTATDCHPLAGQFLRDNLLLNGLLALPYRHGQWALADEEGQPYEEVPSAPVLEGRFDVLMGSDLLYERDDGGMLPSFIERHAQPRAQVWLVDPNRGNRAAFNRRMAALGFDRQEEMLNRTATPDRPAYAGRFLTYRR